MIDLRQYLASGNISIPQGGIPKTSPDWFPAKPSEYETLRRYCAACVELAQSTQALKKAQQRHRKTSFFSYKYMSPSGKAGGAIAGAAGAAATLIHTGATFGGAILAGMAGITAAAFGFVACGVAIPALIAAGSSIYVKSKKIPAFAKLANRNAQIWACQKSLREIGAPRFKELGAMAGSAIEPLLKANFRDDVAIALILRHAADDLGMLASEKGYLIGVTNSQEAQRLAQIKQEKIDQAQRAIDEERQKIQQVRADIARQMAAKFGAPESNSSQTPADLESRLESMGNDGRDGLAALRKFRQIAQHKFAHDWDLAEAGMFTDKRIPALVGAYEQIPADMLDAPSSSAESKTVREHVREALADALACAESLSAAQVRRAMLAAQIESQVVSEAAKKAGAANKPRDFGLKS